MDLVYGVCQHERDMSGRARSLHLMCDYYFIIRAVYIYYIHSDLMK